MARAQRQSQLREFALIGARARLQELRQEESKLREVFPELFRGGGSTARASSDNGTSARRRGRRKMSAAERKAVSERMRRYWADRRKKAGQK